MQENGFAADDLSVLLMQKMSFGDKIFINKPRNSGFFMFKTMSKNYFSLVSKLPMDFG